MTRSSRNLDWGFPRWRGYGTSSEATQVKLCDRHNCENKGDRPAPKSPNSPERWYFCEAHAAEYNRGWNYFEGLSAEDAAAREAEETRDATAYQAGPKCGWGGPGDAPGRGTKCVRSVYSNSTMTRLSRTLALRGGVWPRPITPT